MSAPINNTCFKILFNFTRNHRKFVQNSSLKCLSSLTKFRFYSTSTEKSIKDEEALFIRPDVQKILSKITGFNLDKIFGFRQVPDVAAPKYKLLTDAELQEQNEETKLRVQKKLQMAPVKKAWNVDHSTMKVISSDQEIANFERSSCQYVFTDITYGIPNRDRIVAVRETSGLLRLADNKERDRTLQVYFPRPGKMYNMPKLFEEENLEKVLGEERYVYVLDRACVQFEPDDPDYIRVTRRTYEHMASNKKFDDLRSTRHFGPMVFYFAFHKRIDDLLIDMLHRNLLDDADSLVKLFHIMHPDCKSANESLKNKITDTYELIRTFAAHDAMKSTPLEQALDAHQMQHEQISRQQSNK